jgi:hypothetical protein
MLVEGVSLSVVPSMDPRGIVYTDSADLFATVNELRDLRVGCMLAVQSNIGNRPSLTTHRTFRRLPLTNARTPVRRRYKVEFATEPLEDRSIRICDEQRLLLQRHCHNEVRKGETSPRSKHAEGSSWAD